MNPDVPLSLADARVHRNGWEVALAQETVKLCCALGALDEDDDLVVCQVVKQVVELPVLLALGALDEVLLQTV